MGWLRGPERNGANGPIRVEQWPAFSQQQVQIVATLAQQPHQVQQYQLRARPVGIVADE